MCNVYIVVLLCGAGLIVIAVDEATAVAEAQADGHVVVDCYQIEF